MVYFGAKICQTEVTFHRLTVTSLQTYQIFLLLLWLELQLIHKI